MGRSTTWKRKNSLYVLIIYFIIYNVETTEEKGHFIFKFDWIRDENGGLEFVNKGIISK